MKINSYNLGMESERLYKSSASSRREVRYNESSMSTGSQLSSFANMFMGGGLGNSNSPNMALQEEEYESQAQSPKPWSLEDEIKRLNQETPISRVRTLSKPRDVASEFQKIREQMVKYIFELLFGKRGKREECNDEVEPNCGPGFENSTLEDSNEGFSDSGSFFVNTIAESRYMVTHFEETESTSFSANGVIRTEDGREIDISMNVSMSRRFESTFSEFLGTSVRRACDPLVINLKDIPAGLSDTKFFFDLDADGIEDEISELTNGAGFIALDKNGDGIINDGSELFGAKSGSGFADLAAYDEDHNGWIDENDSIFDKLRIWTKDENGNDVLYTLKSQNVGALYTGAVDTEFSHKSSMNNEANGYVRQTGLFLYEDGLAGTLQHIDLVS